MKKEEDLIIQVQKKDGTLDEFNRDKINRALTMACRKRQVTIDQIETLITGLEAELRSEGIRIVIRSKSVIFLCKDFVKWIMWRM